MSIGIYAFLRIYFFGFGLSDFAQFRTHCAGTSAPPPSRSARRGMSGIGCRRVQRVQRSGVCVVPCVACAAACAVQSVRVCWGLGLHLWGIWGEPGVGWSTPRVEKIQKRRFPCLPAPSFPHKSPPPHFQSQNFPQKQKDPYKGSVFCAILALQALKGRNL